MFSLISLMKGRDSWPYIYKADNSGR